jgi:PAS domain S-box-containing protein
MNPEQRGEDRDQSSFHIEEADLSASEEAFRLLADALPGIVWTSQPDGRVDYYNQPFYDFTGYTRETFRFRYWGNILHPDDQERTLAVWAYAYSTGTPYEIEYRVRRHDTESYHWFLVRATPITNAEGRIIKWFGTGTDIDQRKQAEEKLLFHASLARSILDAIVVTSLESTILSWNSAAEEIYGWKAEEVLGKSFNDTVRTQYPAPIKSRDEWIKMVLKRGYWSGEMRQQRRDGAWLDLQTGMSVFRNIEGKATGLVGIIRDITEQKLEEQRKDTFIGMASHELKTPLTTVKGFVQLLKRQLKRLDMNEQVGTLGKIEGQVNVLAELVNELMDVSRVQAGRLEYTWEELDIDAVVKHVVEMVQQTSRDHAIKVKGKSCRTITGDRAHLERVLTNLLTNAIKYSPQANRVDITLGCTESGVLISVRDYGIGISQAEQEHIFERFYRSSTAWSKAIGGLGMGLYIVQEIVNKHGGKINVESKEGEGTTFSIELPFPSERDETDQSSGDSSGSDDATSDR